MTPSRSGRSTDPSPRRGRAPRPVDVYLLPAVVGGGLGDIEEVLAAGRILARAGFPLTLFRRPGRSLPGSVDGPWDWPPLTRRRRIVRTAPAALTVSPAWGLTAAPGRAGPFGRGGAWEAESADIERAYGPGATLHVSLEEFARTLTPSEENRERFREGGVAARDLGHRLVASRRSGELAAYRESFAHYRQFERPNVLHLFASFRSSSGFARQFPNAIQTGPLWPERAREPRRADPGAGRSWIWYASPASAETIAADVVTGLRDADPPIRLFVRTPRPWTVRFPDDPVDVTSDPVPAGAWREQFEGAELRIVTGSRTLLEAIEVGGPFLYFNGVLGAGSARRRHRPEKFRALDAVLGAAGGHDDLRRDLADFARGRRVASVVRRAAHREGGWVQFPRRIRPVGFRPPYDDAGRLLVAVARALGRTPHDALDVVARTRSGGPL